VELNSLLGPCDIVKERAVVPYIEHSSNITMGLAIYNGFTIVHNATMGFTSGKCIALHLLAQMVEDFEVYTLHQRHRGLCITNCRLKVPTTKLGKLSLLGYAPYFVNINTCTCIIITQFFSKFNLIVLLHFNNLKQLMENSMTSTYMFWKLLQNTPSIKPIGSPSSLHTMLEGAKE
jgi:hypothetical protein